MFRCEYWISGKFSKKLQSVGGEIQPVSGSGNSRTSDGEDSGQSSHFGELIQFLVKHNHRWKDIQTYTLSELGVFVKEATKETEYQFKSQTLAVWTGTHADGEHIQSLLNDSKDTKNSASIKGGSKKPQNSATSEREWKRLAMALGSLK